jgi:hypothetical protein
MVSLPSRILEVEEVRAGPKSQAPFGVAKFGAMAFANMAIDKVEDPLDGLVASPRIPTVLIFRREASLSASPGKAGV